MKRSPSGRFPLVINEIKRIKHKVLLLSSTFILSVHFLIVENSTLTPHPFLHPDLLSPCKLSLCIQHHTRSLSSSISLLFLVPFFCPFLYFAPPSSLLLFFHLNYSFSFPSLPLFFSFPSSPLLSFPLVSSPSPPFLTLLLCPASC